MSASPKPDPVADRAPEPKPDPTSSAAGKPLPALPPCKPGLPLVGAQLSAAGGLGNVATRAAAAGAEVVQIFNTNPRMWRSYVYPEDEIAAMASDLLDAGIPLFIHSVYLINLVSPDPALRERSAQALSQALVLGADTRAKGVVTHVGSHHGAGLEVALQWAAATVRIALDAAAETSRAPLPRILFENSPGSGHLVGGGLHDLAMLVAELPGATGICLDTAHMFVAGIPIHLADGLEQLVSELRALGLLDALGLLHLNDSKTPFASGRDQHQNPGEGQIGGEGLARVVRHPAFRHVPFVLEVPGADGHGPDAINVRRVQAMREASPNLPSQPGRPSARLGA